MFFKPADVAAVTDPITTALSLPPSVTIAVAVGLVVMMVVVEAVSSLATAIQSFYRVTAAALPRGGAIRHRRPSSSRHGYIISPSYSGYQCSSNPHVIR